MKGYYTSYGYMGLIGDTYILFPSEREYEEYYIENEERSST